MRRLWIFGSRLARRQRRVYGAVVAFYAVAVLGVTWPVYSWFSRPRPIVLGMPFSLFYLACFVVASFLVLLALFRWELRHEAPDEEAGPDPRS